MAQLTLHICGDCPGADLSVLEGILPTGVLVLKAPCLNACDKPVAVTFQGSGAAYVFHGINPAADAADIAATAQTYLDSPEGWIEDARPCGRLRFCLRARLPSALGL